MKFRFILRKIKNILRYIFRYIHSVKYKLIKNPNEYFDVASHICDEQWVTMHIPEIYNSAKERIVEGKYPSEDFYIIDNAVIGVESDIVITEHGVWWDKYYDDDFLSTAIPYDCNVLSFTQESIRIVKRKNRKKISGITFSLLGVFSSAWSHFLFQFICKLFLAKEVGLLKTELTLLVDRTNDANIEEMIDLIINDYPNVKKQYAELNTDYYCEKLLCMRSTSSNYNEMKYWLEHRQLTPQNVIDTINKYIVNPLIQKIKDEPTKYNKLFLPRRNNRFLNNNKEIEDFFKKEGFYFVEGAEYTLLEKANLFYHADIIVGLHGAAWLNTIFCNNVKCLMLGNNRNILEPTFYTLSYDKVDKWINVTGKDDDDSRRSNFEIPLKKIKEAYTHLIQE